MKIELIKQTKPGIFASGPAYSISYWVKFNDSYSGFSKHFGSLKEAEEYYEAALKLTIFEEKQEVLKSNETPQPIPTEELNQSNDTMERLLADFKKENNHDKD